MADAKIIVEGLQKSFANERVLNDVNLSVSDGASLVLLGESGSGKTLILKCIMGLIKPDSGGISIDGFDTLDFSGRERDKFLARCGMLFQQSALFDSMTVWKSIGFRLDQTQDMGRTEVRQIAVQKLSNVGPNSDVADLYPNELSGAVKKRVGLALSLIHI